MAKCSGPLAHNVLRWRWLQPPERNRSLSDRDRTCNRYWVLAVLVEPPKAKNAPSWIVEVEMNNGQRAFYKAR